MQITLRRKSIRFGILFTLIAVLQCGCGSKGDRVTGTVSFKGSPVPRGKVYFAPDVSKGHQGAAGYADIIDGVYDTALEGSRGIVAGPMVVTVEGMDPNPAPAASGEGAEDVVSTLLFAGYKMEADIPPGGFKLDIEVPDSAAGVPKSEPESAGMVIP